MILFSPLDEDAKFTLKKENYNYGISNDIACFFEDKHMPLYIKMTTYLALLKLSYENSNNPFNTLLTNEIN